MSVRQISLSEDIQRLVDEGFEVQVQAGCLRILNIPYLTADGSVSRGSLAYVVQWAGDVATPPPTHVAYFAGQKPYRATGKPLKHIIGEGHRQLAPGVGADYELSSKPPEGKYPDHFEMVSTYVALLEGPAQSVDGAVSARTFAPVAPAPDDGVFNYWDTARSNVDVIEASESLRVGAVAIVGVGGTGSYVLDLLAKCPIAAIHIFDGDTFFSHNAFRAPGAASLEQLRAMPSKVQYLAEQYGKMHRNVVPHDVFLDGASVEELRHMDFVFFCMDRGKDKAILVDQLEQWGTPFLDVGMGVDVKGAAVMGTVRVTTSTPEKRDHVHDRKRIPFTNADADNEYSQSIQIADLSALNAALAVIRWKKLCGFYVDLEHEHFCSYDTDGNFLLNEDTP